jgi:hypothetical protein
MLHTLKGRLLGGLLTLVSLPPGFRNGGFTKAGPAMAGGVGFSE